MTFDKPLMLALGSMLSLSAAKADLTPSLSAYYDFEEQGAAGLANKAPGATSFNAARGGTLHTDWASGDNPTGPGFAGKSDYTTTSGTSDRSLMLVGKALNLDDDRDEYAELPLGSAQLGGSFSISTWHALTPGSTNASNRYHVFESSNGYDISWGTASTSFTTPQASYNYLAYIAEGAGFGPPPLQSVIWNHAVHSFTSDGATTTLRLYVNGEFVASRSAPTASIDFPSILLGRHRSTFAQDRDWDGMMDEVGVWNRALSANDAKELFLRGVEGLSITANLANAGKGFISVSASVEAGGTTTGTDLYDIGGVASIEAIPSVGYLFNGWSGPFAGKPAAFDHTVTGSAESVASFIQDPGDEDNDGLTNYQEEVVYFTDRADADSDDDGISDGDEVLESLTNPLVSQAAAIGYILAELCDGGLQPGDLVLTRNTASNTLAFRLKASATTHPGVAGTALTPSSPGISGSVSEAGFKLDVPGTADTKRFFRFEGTTPP